MKKYLLVLISVLTFLLVGCGSDNAASAVNATVFTAEEQAKFTTLIDDVKTNLGTTNFSYTSTVNSSTMTATVNVTAQAIAADMTMDGVALIAGDKMVITVTKSGTTYTLTTTEVIVGITATETYTGTDLDTLLNDE